MASSSHSVNPLNGVIVPSPFSRMTTTAATRAIANAFNQERASIMTDSFGWLFQTRLIRPDQFRLVHKNNLPELVPYSPQPLRRKKLFNLTDTSATIGVFNQSEPLIGANGHYVVNVPPGQVAKVFDGNRAQLLGSGQHVIHSDRFRFDPATDLVNITEPYIQHNDIHILQVPPGKIAAVTMNNRSYLLESRPEPYVFRTQRFSIQRGRDENERRSLFHQANTKYMKVGSVMRLLPDVGEVGVINDGGRLRIVEPSHDNLEPISIDSATSRFAGFLSTNLANVEFPSAEVRRQHVAQGVSAANAVYDYFYTQDAVKVGVKFFVSYRITNPALTLEHLSLEDISKHIEAVVNSDMGNAIQQTSIQNLLSSNLSKPHDSTAPSSSTLSIDPSGKGKGREREPEQFNHWQDKVKTKLKEDLEKYGIELVRLNIEEAKILNADIEKEMSEQAVTVAKANAEKAALDANLAVKRQKADQERELALLTQETQGQVLEQQARAQVEAARLQAEATTIASRAELDMRSQQAELEIQTQSRKAKVLQTSPQAMMMAIMQEFARALTSGNFSSALPISDLSNVLAMLLGQVKKSFSPEKPLGETPASMFSPACSSSSSMQQGADDQELVDRQKPLKLVG